MTPPRLRRRFGLAASLAWAGLACATSSLPESEPQTPRPPQIAGLAPVEEVPPETSPSRPQPSAGPPAAVTSPPVPAPTTACQARVGATAVKRTALRRTLDAGLGTWLRGVDVEAKVDHGRFQGWLVRSVFVGDPCWADVDLRTGDIVTRVNRLPIERPEEAQTVWTGLRAMGEIVVDYVRSGRPRTLRFRIVDAAD